MMRLYYLRDRSSLQRKADNTLAKGDPVAAIMTDLNLERGTVRYSVGMTGGYGTKRLMRDIARERLTGTDARGKSKATRPGGAREIKVDVNVVFDGTHVNGHEVMRAVMNDICTSNVYDVAHYAGEWLDWANSPKEV